MGLSRAVSEIDGDFSRKMLPPPCILRPPWRGSPGIWVPALGVKNLNAGATGPTKKCDDIFSRGIQCSNVSDGQTPGDSKDRDYA